MTILAANLGYPRIGQNRALKFALEAYWSGKTSQQALLGTAAGLRADHWRLQQEKGIEVIPSNDFSLYDHVLDTAVMVGAIPEAYGWTGGPVDLDVYFALARGVVGETSHDEACGCGRHEHSNGVPALEMTKWFDTNYHYMVPELHERQRFKLTTNKPLEAFVEAKVLGIHTRPVLLGPITFLKLSKTWDGSDPVALLDRLLPVYGEILAELSEAGADWIQIDEPCLTLDLTQAERDAFVQVYAALKTAAPELRIMLTSFFGPLGDNLATVMALPIDGLHLDLVRGGDELFSVVEKASPALRFSLGAIDGRNIWRAHVDGWAEHLGQLVNTRREAGIEIAPSCSLLHVPIDVADEIGLDPELRSWLSFANQKLGEVALLAHALNGVQADADKLLAASHPCQARVVSDRVRDPQVKARLAEHKGAAYTRKSPFSQRQRLQHSRFGLPLFPTTTIGSFPQTDEVRQARLKQAKGELLDAGYQAFLEAETEAVVRWQEEIGLDVLVHGEFERNDMVQYFGEQLTGFAFTKFGWVQSYGSRCVRPPIIYGDVSRPNPMTVGWWQFAQGLTERPVKGMLTGPVTILNWSFVRDDLPRATVCRQIAFAVRDEVLDLEAAGAAMIQIDEAALREGLPLRKADWQDYLDWAVEAFRICSSGVADETQIHTHMCYSEFNDIMAAVAAMDADVISIETSRSRMEILDIFIEQGYPNEIGPGVYDIHSPRVPGTDEIKAMLSFARERLSDGQLWVNPDCGLKTRKWPEVREALVHMVEAAVKLRGEAAQHEAALSA